jgi:hypothetical protein
VGEVRNPDVFGVDVFDVTLSREFQAAEVRINMSMCRLRRVVLELSIVGAGTAGMGESKRSGISSSGVRLFV